MPVEEMFRKSLKEHKESRNKLHDLFDKANPAKLEDPEFAHAVKDHENLTIKTIKSLRLAAKTAKNKELVKALVDDFKDKSEMQIDMCNRFINAQLLNPFKEKLEESESIAPHKVALMEGNPNTYFSIRFKDSDRILEVIEKELHNHIGTPDDNKKDKRHNPRASC